jgi:Caspase domain
MLVGTWKYAHLPSVPAVGYSLARMQSLICSDLCGWPPARVTVVQNEQTPGNLPDRLVASFENVTDVALFYYVGHGLLDDKDQLCLGLGGSRREAHRRATTSLPFEAVRRALQGSPAAIKIIILDCCYSGWATLRENALADRQNDLVDKIGGTGAYTMTASSAYEVAWYETDSKVRRPQTYFTKYLADLLEAGIPGQPRGLKLHPLFTILEDKLARDQRPLPRERGVDAARDFVFARNVAPPDVRINSDEELVLLRKWKAEAEARERAFGEQFMAITRELEDLKKRRNSRRDPDGRQERQVRSTGTKLNETADARAGAHADHLYYAEALERIAESGTATRDALLDADSSRQRRYGHQANNPITSLADLSSRDVIKELARQAAPGNLFICPKCELRIGANKLLRHWEMENAKQAESIRESIRQHEMDRRNRQRKKERERGW